MESQVSEWDCKLKVTACTCDDCCIKLRIFFSKIHGVRSVELIAEKKLVLIKGDAHPIRLVHAVQAEGAEAEIMYYRKPELTRGGGGGGGSGGGDCTHQDNNTPQSEQHFDSAAANENTSAGLRRRPTCRLQESYEDDYNREREGEGYPGHVRESYVAAVPPPGVTAHAEARKECSVLDCPFHDYYLKSVVPVAPPQPASMGFYGNGYITGLSYGFQQRPPASWGYGYGHRTMM